MENLLIFYYGKIFNQQKKSFSKKNKNTNHITIKKF